MTAKDFIPDSEFDSTPNYPVVFGITFRPAVTGVVLAVLGIGAGAFLAANFTLPAWDQYQQLTASVAAKETEVKTQQESLKQIAQAKEDLEKAKQARRDVLTLFANDNTLDTLLIDLNRVVTQRNAGVLASTRKKLNACPSWVRDQFDDPREIQQFEKAVGQLVARAELKRFTPDATASGLVRDASLGAGVTNKLRREVVNVELQGNFSQVQSILRSIERLQPLLVITDFNASVVGPQSNAQGVGGLYEIRPDSTIRFLTNCQPETTVTTAFKLQALIPVPNQPGATPSPAPTK